MVDSSKLFTNIPTGLTHPLIQSYQSIGKNYIEHKWEPAELNGGKFCETVYTIINGAINGAFPPRPTKPPNMVTACRALEEIPQDPQRTGDRSLRILIPRAIQVLYEIRNNRGVGHVSGEIDPNFLDATAVYEMASWILSEMIRIFHTINIKEAQETVNALIERKLPLIWELEDIKLVLDPSMNKQDQALLLLYTKPSWVLQEDLIKWVEYSSLSMFKNRILKPLHKLRLVAYDGQLGRVQISPLGSKEVEQRILKTNMLS